MQVLASLFGRLSVTTFSVLASMLLWNPPSPGDEDIPVLQQGLKAWFEAANFKCTYTYFRGVVTGFSVEDLAQMQWESSDPHIDLDLPRIGHGSLMKLGEDIKFSINFDRPFQTASGDFKLADGQLAFTNLPVTQISDREKAVQYELPGTDAGGRKHGNTVRAERLLLDGSKSFDVARKHLFWSTPISLDLSGFAERVLRLPFDEGQVDSSTVPVSSDTILVKEYSDDGSHTYASEVLLGTESDLPYVKEVFSHIEQHGAEKKTVAHSRTLYLRFETIDGCKIASRVILLSRAGADRTSIDVFDTTDLGESSPDPDDMKLVVPADARMYGVSPGAIPAENNGHRLLSLEHLSIDDFGSGFFFEPTTQTEIPERQHYSSLFFYTNGVLIVVFFGYLVFRLLKPKATGQ